MKVIIFLSLVFGLCTTYAKATKSNKPVASTSAHVSGCPTWIKQKKDSLPLCPEGDGPTLIPETYPIGAFVVSDQAMQHATTFTAETVIKVLEAAGEDLPLMILPVSKETFTNIHQHIDSLSISSSMKKKWKSTLMYVNAPSYTWQQDYMQSYTDPKTGQMILREVSGYRRHGNTFNQIAEAVKKCGLAAGPALKPQTVVSGASGGNIEALPGGICLLGDDHFTSQDQYEDYANQVCNGHKEKRIMVSTSWLTVGHTDEIMKVVRNKNKKSPCDFTVALASPRKAIELLDKSSSETFLDFPTASEASKKQLTLNRSQVFEGLRMLCKKHVLLQNSPRFRKDKSKTTRAVADFFDWYKVLISEANAESAISSQVLDCASLTNEDVQRVFQNDPNLKLYNELVQKEMDALKVVVAQKLKKSLPQCETDFIEVPNLFYGGEVVHGANGPELPYGLADSLLPNPTNGISINDTMISSDPSNSAFRQYLADEYTERGLKAEFIDSFDYAHIGNGNLHCSSNTIHVCKPRGEE